MVQLGMSTEINECTFLGNLIQTSFFCHLKALSTNSVTVYIHTQCSASFHHLNVGLPELMPSVPIFARYV